MPTVASQPPIDLELKPVKSHQQLKRSADETTDTNQSITMREGSEAEQRSNSNRPFPSKKQPAPPPLPAQPQAKKMTRKTSKPIINWFQRKLAGTVRARRASDGDALRGQRVNGTRSPNIKDKNRRSSVPSVPPLPAAQLSRKSTKGSRPRPSSTIASAKRNTISLNGSDDFSSIRDGHTADSSEDYRSSLARESTWSPTSAREADEDASVRPLPPSSPPSPSPSHSSSSYLSDPRTFASMAISTKPTTLLSVDLSGGMAHIAQAPPTPTTLSHRLAPHVRTHSNAPSSGGSVMFSSLSPSRPSSIAQLSRGAAVNAPQHTTHHPRNNPRPSSPPLDDASVLTLASSAFGIPGARIGVNAMIGRRSLADDSLSHFSGTAGLGDSASHFLLGELEGDDDRLLLDDRDGDVAASVRALRPRSSRRNSWGSETSGWSAQLSTGIGQPSALSALQDRSLWTMGSYRTDGRSVDALNDEEYDTQTKDEYQSEGDNVSRSIASTRAGVEGTWTEGTSVTRSLDVHPRISDDIQAPPADGNAANSQLSPPPSHITQGPGQNSVATRKDRSQETPKVTTKPLEEVPEPPAIPASSTVTAVRESDGTLRGQQDLDQIRSIPRTTDQPTDIFLSAPSSPAALSA